ncbi:MAG: hypothetical protein COV32_01315 [Candidatus Yonathbacteria bacterium CG10_big_fil_rev_8_21_14_0_10_43_136]|uniref:Arrestin-like N-terminal domain-containing protein n=1 Tax=Candidatus Yonathbacteria bacterium CG_4_10_14_0_8_um_filter_43_17 TaxID=1975099 RepID=A0A2M7Q5F8_9BACT|nr:MAG: hypothetical protein COW60_00080 [Candidatus Yonathbacteria bacterium CG17_big_fil_post_rev_8_21_14_2_50_43_9]PIR40772.1 MAG: hypothetical protein COV32_01315 [Candidatus Yonathbacteria bacterium CG10_big_fil_rev_8_21_14_0_10_43_136]PIX56846.1 MAG: hypothetical protein COZ48_03755 [Candidatus Yonathbacteria bacterium CG_4_10_14_3_um_filter_43_12]PIY58305.1 MAG: hypothetical protein COY98_02705 [Candidatus Yonathbacteria bacterium CG_4_10_14_0_8_um_filter_43_17]PJC21903.1 MAG: hypothetic
MSKINLVLDKQQFSVNDKIAGKITLFLDEPTKAQKLSVKLIITEKVKSMNIPTISSTNIGVSNSSSNTRSYSFDLVLGGEKEYINGEEYHFEMSIPGEALPRGLQGVTGSVGGLLGSTIGILSQFSPLGQSVYLYKIEARLDVPWSIDVTAIADITIG